MAPATAPAPALPSILLILAMAFTIATTTVAYRPSPRPSNQSIVMQKCTEALGLRGTVFVTFCARNLLGHRAALLATCDRRKTLAVVIKEVYNKAKAVEALEKKINSDKSLSTKDAQDLKGCWGITNKVVSSIANVFHNSTFVKEPSTASVMTVLKGRMKGEIAAIKQHCDPTVAGRQKGLWLELRLKALESLRADIVAWAFVDHLYRITH